MDEVILDTPVNRYALPAEAPKAAAIAAPAPAPKAAPAALPAALPPAQPPGVDAVQAAQAAAAAARTLDDLRAAIEDFAHCDLKKGARNTVFADGNRKARVLILGEAPGRDEDQAGRPFVGRAGQLLDRMFAAIGLSRHSPDAETALYITNVMPWRPPGNRDPEPAEIAMMRPFVLRHIELADPAVIVAMGNTPLVALTGQSGILRARGTWAQALDRPLLPMTHPAYLLRSGQDNDPQRKRNAWADLLSLKQRLSDAAR
ncbi:MAG: uracil-DNA glycosylase [Fuscovulum sp.]|nr:uracil-DNA glycosylase [Fuscovulum sp.]